MPFDLLLASISHFDPQRTSVGFWRVQEKHSQVLASFDLDQWLVWSLPMIASMKPHEEQFSDKDEPTTPNSCG
jgi:hypothetical protein